MSDHRPIGLISSVAKLFEQILLPRLTLTLLNTLSPDQAGGWMGADAAALYVWELLTLRAAGRCPDAVNGKALTWLAFLDLESFFDRVWRKGLLHALWKAGVKGKTFLLLRSYLETTTLYVIISGRVSESWESILGVLQGSVLSMIFSALYLCSLQRALDAANLGARWIAADGTIRRTNSRFYVDDGLLPAETQSALQKMLEIVCAWTCKWRVKLRLGTDKTAFMCTGGNDPGRNGHVFINTIEGERVQLQAVSCYVYLGLLIQCNLKNIQLLETICKIGNQRTWAVSHLAAKHNLTTPRTLIMWHSLAYNAVKHLLTFCPINPRSAAKLSRTQEKWAKAILGWDPKLSGQAAISDLGWQHITRLLMMTRCALLARIMKLPDTPVFTRFKDILNAASSVSTCWTHHTTTMFQVAINPIPPPIGLVTWHSLIPLATRNLKSLMKPFDAPNFTATLTSYSTLNIARQLTTNIHSTDCRWTLTNVSTSAG